MLSQDQQEQLNKLMDYRDQISDSVFHIERILKIHFPDEFNIAYQHYIPQIITALYSDDRWLDRGETNMQKTISRILDKSQEETLRGVSKFIKK